MAEEVLWMVVGGKFGVEGCRRSGAERSSGG